MGNKPRFDWAAIEAEYRTTHLSARAIAKRHGVHHSTLFGKIKEQKWERTQEAIPSKRTDIDVPDSSDAAATAQKAIVSRIRKLAHTQLDLAAEEYRVRGLENKGFKISVGTRKIKRIANPEKVLKDVTALLQTLIKIEGDIFKIQRDLAPAPAPAAAGAKPVHGKAAQESVQHAPVPLHERLAIYEQERAIEAAKKDHAALSQGPEQKVVDLAGHG